VIRCLLTLNIDRYLLEPVVVILDVAILKEDDRVVFVCLHALFAECVSALVTCTLNFLALVPVRLTIRYSRVASLRTYSQH